MSKAQKEKQAGKKVPASIFVIVMIALLIVLVVSVLLSITFGNADIAKGDVFRVVIAETFGVDSMKTYSDAIHDVVWLIRFPRALLALAVGMGLSVCGAVMQAVVKNPLADPYVLGISSGASLGATLAIILGVGTMFGSNFVGVCAFLGAMATAFGVMMLSNIGGKSNAGKLILSGMALSTVCAAFSNFILYIGNNKNATQQVTFWTMGSLAGAEWGEIAVVLPVMIIGSLIFWSQYRNLNLMLLGDEVSITLGTDLHRVRNMYMIISSFMVGFAVYSAGMIGFVGLIIPHAIRMLFGTDHRRLIPLCALTGAIFLIWCDVACRVILPNSELPIGILVSIIGAPCFIYLMVRRSYGFGGGKQ